ncbi:dermonecrotic toxin domain-containing protein [Pseudomonas sp. X10]
MNTQYVNAKGVQYVRNSIDSFPRPDRSAADAIRQWANERGMDLDPDRIDAVTLHYQFNHEQGWVGVITQKMTLTQAVLSNWQGESNNDLIDATIGAPWAGHFPEGPLTVVDSLRGQGLIHYDTAYSVYNGLFRQTTTAEYSPRTHVQIPAEDFQSFIWELDFHSHYKAALDNYWNEGLDTYRNAAKINFIVACNKQVSEGSLSDAGRRLAWQVAGLETPPPIIRPDGKKSSKPRVKARMLNVYGYAATDLLCLSDSISGLTLLYIPGNSSPLHEFSDAAQMQDWFAEQCKSAPTRAALQAHFALADREDGLSYSGLHTALCGLGNYPQPYHLDSNRPGFTAEGIWPPRDYINYKAKEYSPPIAADLFLTLARRQKQRSYKDADFIITSDDEVTKAKWRGYLNSAINLLAPLALVLPELAPLFALGGVAQFGLGLDQAIHGKNVQAQAEGVGTAVFGLLNAAPLVHAGLSKEPALFRVKQDGFVLPSRANGQIGYPLSPITPPHLPMPEVAEYFHMPDAISPLPGGDPAIAGSVIRKPCYDGTSDMLSSSIGGYNTEVMYDLEADAFIEPHDQNAVDPSYYIATPNSQSLIGVNINSRTVTNEMRMASLRALGIDLHLPVEIPMSPAEDLRPIPKQFLSLWVGDKVLDDELLSNLARNAERLEDSQYTLRLYLSNATPAAFQENLRLLAERAPGVTVLPLEEQAFYVSFRESPSYAQYAAAIDGNGGVACNFSSASDVLRYALLDHEGGLYMDVDDSLLAPGEYPFTNNGVGIGLPGEALDQVDLVTTQDGLLLFPPLSNEELGMNCLYNGSLIGSHAGNPTLKAIAEEMHARYLAEPGFYDSKPSRQSDPEGFYRYTAALNRLTGPALLTDVVDRHLPALQVMRQIINLHSVPHLNSWLFIDGEAYREAQRQLLPLNRIARVGGYNSWARP